MTRFREPKTFDDFDLQFNPSIKRKLVFDLATGRFIREARDVLLLGPPGIGKSHLAQAFGHAVIKSGFTVLYRSIFDLVRDFLSDEAVGGQDKTLERYLRPDLVMIDDMGMKQLPKRSGEYLFTDDLDVGREGHRQGVAVRGRFLDVGAKYVRSVDDPAVPEIVPCRRQVIVGHRGRVGGHVRDAIVCRDAERAG